MRIQLEQVTKSYGSQVVLDEVSLAVKDGEAVVLTGASGIGKTTLLRLILGLEQPDSGRIVRTGADGGEILTRRHPLQAACVFQEDRLLEELSARENVQLASGAGEEEAMGALRELLPEEALEKPVSALSGGMRRRVCLVRACLYPAELLVLDEPFTGLDEENRSTAIRFLMEHRRGRTLLLASHSLEGLAFCREIALPQGEERKKKREPGSPESSM